MKKHIWVWRNTGIYILSFRARNKYNKKIRWGNQIEIRAFELCFKAITIFKQFEWDL